jgi:hypothetical protein
MQKGVAKDMLQQSSRVFRVSIPDSFGQSQLLTPFAESPLFA